MIGPRHLLAGAAASLLALRASALDETIVVGQTFIAGSADPTSGSTGWALVSHGIAEKLYTVNQKDEIVPQLAEKATKVNDLEWDVTLKPDGKFSDGTDVTAENVAACLNELNEKNDSANSSLGKFTATPQEGRTLRIKSERPTHVMDAVLAEWVFTIFLDKGDGNFVFTGPYAIEELGEDQIDLVPNTYYDRADERPKIALKKFADGDALAEGMKEGGVDIGMHLPIHTLPDLRKTDGVRVKSFEVGYHYMAFHNIDTLQDVRVRKAIDLAIDRTALSEALAGGNPTRSLFPDYSPYYTDDSDKNGDPDKAAALLDEAGWKINSATGLREKDGEALKVHAVAYPQRPGLPIMLPLIEESLKDLGIDVEATVTDGSSWDELDAIMADRTFDVLLWAQHTLPAGDPLYFLNSFFRSDGGSNHARLESDTVDDLLDKLSVVEDHGKRVEAAAAAHAAILDEVPVSNLVTPVWHVGLSDRMKDYQPWGADYYVIRPDLVLEVAAGDGDEGEGEDAVSTKEVAAGDGDEGEDAVSTKEVADGDGDEGEGEDAVSTKEVGDGDGDEGEDPVSTKSGAHAKEVAAVATMLLASAGACLAF